MHFPSTPSRLRPHKSTFDTRNPRKNRTPGNQPPAEVLLFILTIVVGMIGLGPIMFTDTINESNSLGFIYPLRSVLTVALIALSLSQGKRIKPTPRLFALAAYLLFLIFSSAWSIAPDVTLRAAVDMALFVFATLLLVSDMRPDRFANVLMNMLSFALIPSFLVAMLAPSVGVDGEIGVHSIDHVGLWRGIFVEKNGLGGTAALACAMMTLCFRQWTAPTWLKLIALGSAGLCLIRAGSSTAFIGEAAMIALAASLHGKPGTTRVAVLWTTVIALAFLAVSTTLPSDIMRAVGGDPTFSNRTIIWRETQTVVRQAPLMGLGFSAGTKEVLLPYLVEVIGLSARHAHSSYLEAIVETGYVGLFLLLGAVLFNAMYVTFAVGRCAQQQRATMLAIAIFLLGSLFMGSMDILALRLSGGWGALTWVTVAWVTANTRRRSAPTSTAHPARVLRALRPNGMLGSEQVLSRCAKAP